MLDDTGGTEPVEGGEVELVDPTVLPVSVDEELAEGGSVEADWSFAPLLLSGVAVYCWWNGFLLWSWFKRLR